MAVSIQYVVTHKGVEKLVTADKKAADQYDKMLDIADNLQHYLSEKGSGLKESDLESLAFGLAQNKDIVIKLLKGGSAEDLLAQESADVINLKNGTD
jgi:dsDNA-binding SOS-regulon protein